jgi:hypothetical protein
MTVGPTVSGTQVNSRSPDRDQLDSRSLPAEEPQGDASGADQYADDDEE